MTYLVHTGSTSWVVIVSAFLSVASLTETIASDDAHFAEGVLIGKQYEKLRTEGVDRVSARKPAFQYANTKQRTQWMKLFLYLLRIMDIPSKLLFYALIYEVNGLVVSIAVAVNFTVAVTVYFYLKMFSSIHFVDECCHLRVTSS